MRQELIDLYDAFTHGAMSRRDFLARFTILAGGAAAAGAALALLENNYAMAETVAADDPRLVVERTAFVADGVGIAGQLARPKDSAAKLPGVLVIHENRGLNPHIADVGRRVAVEGFMSFAIDALAPFGGTPENSDEARQLIGATPADFATAMMVAAAAWLRRRPDCTGKTGAVGFCWGGAQVNRLAVADPALNAGVAYYGRQAEAAAASKIKAALMLHYAGEDKRINEGIPVYEAALKAAGVDHQVFLYDGAQHAFNNDANEARYNAEAAKLAWERTIGFFREKLA